MTGKSERTQTSSTRSPSRERVGRRAPPRGGAFVEIVSVVTRRLGAGAADHQPPDLFRCARPVRHDPDQAAARQHGDPVADLEQLVEVGRDHERGAAARRQLPDQVADGRGRLHVEPVRRLVEDDHLRLEAQLAREQDLLHVAARERAGPRGDAGRPHVELAHELARALVHDAALDPSVLPERALADPLQEQVQPDRQRADDPLAEPVVRDVAEPELLAGRDGKARHRAAVEQDLAVRRAALARDHLGQRALAVAVDARHAEDLALLQLERDALDAELGSLAGRAHVPKLEHGLGRDVDLDRRLRLHELLAQLRDVRDRAPPRRT